MERPDVDRHVVGERERVAVADDHVARCGAQPAEHRAEPSPPRLYVGVRPQVRDRSLGVDPLAQRDQRQQAALHASGERHQPTPAPQLDATEQREPTGQRHVVERERRRLAGLDGEAEELGGHARLLHERQPGLAEGGRLFEGSRGEQPRLAVPAASESRVGLEAA